MKRKRVCMAVCKGKGHTMNKHTDFSRNATDDVIILDIERSGATITRIITIYDQSARETGERPARRLAWQRVIRELGGVTVLAVVRWHMLKLSSVRRRYQMSVYCIM
jgi:hypothetical protein